MKKFLSLVLAMIMTMSLVTISAGATEYKDLTDKDEIQYEEAVAVLNRIGVITGYDDGSFRPETELTRGAAAKIIVSLLIGPEAANNLPNTYAPYPDVPANHTFAGVISYCKTAGIISGYGDGTFKPANSLTGYAFAKMLLGAIGYDSAIQGYVDTGWTMNVARDGNAAGLFNRIEFDGAAAVNREQACQLALNTLKATMVEYTGGLNVTAGNATVTAAPTLTYKISNQSYATNISNRKASNVGNANVNNHYTVEFGEEHFKDLRLNDEHGTQYSTDKDGKRTLNIARDDFGRPSNKWSYKKVTIGTFPIEPDFVYTERVIHRWDEKVTDAAKVRALELSGYNLKMDDTKENEPVDTTLWMNGVEDAAILDKVADIANYTDNGTQVEVYISEDDSDFIQDVVVVKTQLMEIKNIKSEAVALKVYDDGSDNTSGEGVDNTKGVIGFNSRPLDKKVNDVEVNDECYKTLSGMKVGDIVAVIPVAPEHENEEKFDVSRVYVPETVSGELTWVDTYGTEKSDATGIAVTVGGTDYDVALWNKDLTDIDGTSIRVTRKDVTLYLDEFGNALLAKNVGSTSDFMVIGGYHSGLVDGKVVTYADGWDIKGNELSLNIGNARYDNIGGEGKTKAAFPIGSLVHYSSSTNSKYAEWKLDDQGVFDVASKRTGETTEYTVKASNSRLVLNDYKDGTAYNNDAYPYYSKENDQDAGYVDAKNDNVYVDDNGVKVIYLTMGDDGEVDSVEVKSGMQNISNAEILGEKSGFADEVKRAQACVSLKTDNDVVNADSLVKAIVVKLESGNADLKDLIYVSRYLGSAGKAPGSDNTQRPVYGYEVHFVGSDDWDDEVTIYSYQDLDKGDFARARKPASFPEGVKNVTEDNFYTLTRYSKTQKALSTMEEGEIVFGDKVGFNIKGNKTLIELANYIPSDTNFSKAWPKDSKQDELDLGDEEIINILSLRGAKIIDLTKYEIQSTSELVDELKELNKDDLTFTVSALYNDDKDSDGFRDVHVLVITGTDTAPKHVVPEDLFDVTVDVNDEQVEVTSVPATLTDLKKDTEVTLTIAAKTGFKVDSITVGGEAATPVDGKITFTVVDKDIDVVIKSSAEGEEPTPGTDVTVTVVDADSKGFTLKTEAGDTVAPEADGSYKLDPTKVYVLDSTDAAYFPDIRKGDVRYANTFKPEEGMTLTIAQIAENTFVALKFSDGTTEVAAWYNPPAASPAALAAEEVLEASDVSYAAPVRLEVGKTYEITLADDSTITLKCELKDGVKILTKAGDTTDDQMVAFMTQASKPEGVVYKNLEEVTDPTPVEPTDVPETVKTTITNANSAVANGTNRGTINFAKYKGEALTAEEKEAAIAAAIEKDANGQKPVSLTTAGAIVTAKFSDSMSWKYTVKQDPATKPDTNDGSAAYPTPLFKITLGDKSEYVSATGSTTLKKLGAVKDTPYIWSEVSYAADATAYVFTADKDGLVITGSKLTDANYRKNNYDLTFVEAVEVDIASALIDTSAGTILATGGKVQAAGLADAPITTFADGCYIAKGATLILKAAAVPGNGGTQTFQINGETVVTSAKNTGTDAAAMDVTIANVQPKSSTHKMTITAVTGFKVSVNGTLLEDGKLFTTSDTAIPVPAAAGVKVGDKLVAIKSTDVGQKILGDVSNALTRTAITVGTTGQQLKVDGSALGSAAKIDGVVTLVSVYTLANDTANVTDIRETPEEQPTHSNVSIDGSNEIAYVIPETPGAAVTVYGDMKAVSNGVGFLRAKSTATTIEVVDEVDDGVYELKITGDAATASDLEQCTMTVTTLGAGDVVNLSKVLDGSKDDGSEADTVVITASSNFTSDAYVTSSFADTATGITPASTDAIASNKITLTITAGATCTAAAGDPLTTATVVIHDGADELEFTFTIKNKAGG